MALFSMHIGCVKRSNGKSAVAAAAYMMRASFKDSRTGKRHSYRSNHDTIIDLGSRLNLVDPLDTCGLWNAAELAENRKNSQTARKMMIALPRELDRQTHIDLVGKMRTFLERRYGVATSAAIHYDRPGNPHAHLLFTTRTARLEDGQLMLGKKTRILDDRKTGPAEIEAIRKAWAGMCNDYLCRTDIDCIDHRSYRRRGIELTPLPHLGPAAYALKKRGIATRQSRKWTEASVKRLDEMPMLPTAPMMDRQAFLNDPDYAELVCSMYPLPRLIDMPYSMPDWVYELQRLIEEPAPTAYLEEDMYEAEVDCMESCKQEYLIEEEFGITPGL